MVMGCQSLLTNSSKSSLHKKKLLVPVQRWSIIEQNPSSESIAQPLVCLNLQVTQHFFIMSTLFSMNFANMKTMKKIQIWASYNLEELYVAWRVFKDLYSSANIFSQYNASLTSNWPHFSYSRKYLECSPWNINILMTHLHCKMKFSFIILGWEHACHLIHNDWIIPKHFNLHWKTFSILIINKSFH